MDTGAIRALLKDIRDNRLTVEEGLKRLKGLPYEDIGFAMVDHHRGLRQGFPEVVFCEGKTSNQIKGVISNLLEKGSDVLATRADKKVYETIKRLDKRARYNNLGRTVVIENKRKKGAKGKILILTAGTSDIPVAEEALVTARFLGSSTEGIYDVGVAGVHRIIDKMDSLQGARVIIVVAGMDGALASVVGGLVDKPVIAVPTSRGYGASFGGLSALLAMLNSCASGVAVVNIDNGFGAACIAHRINILGEKVS